MSNDDDVTRTGDREPSDVPVQPPTASRLAAPLQYRDPDRYDILGEHGRGGLGHVSRAHDKELGRKVAIKELNRRGDLGEVRFLREALITARLEHPGIVPIHEAGRWPDGTPFYVMKLVSGRPLKDLIEERRTVEERIGLLHHVIAIADALAYAHERKIIHRDLKPANVIAGDFGETIVIDWGLAKDLNASEGPPMSDGPYRGGANDGLTAAGSVLGTPLYMAPEQARGEAVDQRADVFAIGAMLWELCSLLRVPPQDARARTRMLRRNRIDQDLIAIIAKALAPEPADRYPDAGALAADLKAFKSGIRIAARRYSIFAVLAHWVRRHRALAVSVIAATALAVAGVGVYVRNIAVERDRADNALVREKSQREIADAERDSARLSEASALLDKDPTRARDVLAGIPKRTLQRALLLSRANRGAALRVVQVPGGLAKLRRHPTTSEIVIVSRGGELETIDLDTGKLRIMDRELTGAVTSRGDHWAYARKPSGARRVTVTTTGLPPQTIETGGLLANPTSTLLSAGGRMYALDGSDLYSLEASGPQLIKHGVRSIAGNDQVLMVCTTADELEITRGGVADPRERCVKNSSAWPMVVAGADYAALIDPATLLLVRGTQTLRLPTHITGEYELALSASGLLALADFDDKTWYVPPGGNQLELGPLHAARPMSIAVDGHIAAWGYTDGVVIAIDTKTGETWKFKGHRFGVARIAVDERRARLVSTGGDELRVWSLTPSRLAPLGPSDGSPCKALNVEPSPDHTRVLFDCDNESVRVWASTSGTTRELHRHDDFAFGVAWVRDLACSGGSDGRVICTGPDGTTSEILSQAGQIRRIAASPDHRTLAIAAADGTVRGFDGSLHTLYAHGDDLYALAFSPDGELLASGAYDGSIIVYDLIRHRVRNKTAAHVGTVASLAWRDHDLWSAGLDGKLKHWRDGNEVLAVAEDAREAGPLRFLHLSADGWQASVDGRILVVQRVAHTLRLELDRNVEGLDVSSDDRYVAAAVSGEIVVVDMLRRAVASLPLVSSGIGYVGFAIPDTLTVSRSFGLSTVRLTELDFVPFDHD